ncbi:hypothetical protein FAF44_02900 [Nonomuraea sp. MG754425]|uniref:hypothetical protein n=1 Tax=Nonomuraea sp. MG754425 TaxID=2570319 RepID=UPI001F43BB47|nr:hypothetical protein [Nonomuraea sp. MG754425]MCF6467363.1 hypothetical protein [Nonomuraea sp. MG754425]
MGDISYLQAWQMWLDGQSTLGNDLLGLPMIWWGRIGKIAQFTGGCTILLEILGPERIRALGRVVRRRADGVGIIVYFAVPATLILGISAIALILTGAPMGPWEFAVRALFGMWLLTLPIMTWIWLPKIADFLQRGGRALNWIRLLAFALIAAGFHLDLLAS